MNITFNYSTARYAPCKDCPDRHAGCHGQCDRYAAFRKDRERYHDERVKTLDKEILSVEHTLRFTKRRPKQG